MLGQLSAYPTFELPDHRGSTVRSDALAGSWYLLFWYPKAGTPGCSAQAEGLRDQIEAFDELECLVLGASFDTPADNVAFAAKYSLPFPLLSDLDRALARQVGAAGRDTDRPSRIAHLVAPDGLVRETYIVDDPEFFAERVLDDLEAIHSER